MLFVSPLGLAVVGLWSGTSLPFLAVGKEDQRGDPFSWAPVGVCVGHILSPTPGQQKA